MADITSSGALSRHITEYLTTDKRVKQYKCKTLQNPDYYRTPDGLFLPVDVTEMIDTSTAKAGRIYLRDRSIVSVGTKKADDAYKLIGLRPDECQNGSEQFEISIESIELSGQAQTINLRDRVEVSEIATCFGGNLYVQRARQRCRVMALAHNTDDSFKIVYRLHMKGLTPVYRADLDEWWIYNDAGQFRFRIGRPYLVGMDMNPLEVDAPMVKHSLVEISKGEYRYTKEPAPAFESADLPAEYLIDSDTVYSSTADGYVGNWGSKTWATVHNAATGTLIVNTVGSYASGASCSYLNLDGLYKTITRDFFYYSLSGLSGSVTAVDECIYGYTNNESNVSAQKGTQADTLTTADFDSFTGNYYAYVNWNINQYNTLTYNAQGLSDVTDALGSTFKSCCREYTHDYLNSDPGTSNYRNGIYFADDTSGTKDPYLYVTTGGGGSPVFLPNIMKHNFIPPLIGGF